MTKEETPTSKKSGHGRGDKHHGHNKEKVKPQTKIIIRHLPPTMTEDEFLKQFDPLPKNDFYYFAPPDWSLGYDATCRAYITLKNYDDVFLFRDRFDGYVCVDNKGAEYPAIVEFAPFQGFAKNKSRNSDNKVNTIELEPHYQQFLAKLEEDREAAAKGGECKLEFTLDRKKDEKITSTPLLQYLANKKEKRREEAKKRTEEKRRQRDEEKRQLAQKSEQQVSKLYNIGVWHEGDNKKEGGSSKDGHKMSAAGGDAAAQDAAKVSRSKRRVERNQRRHEAYVQRKMERDSGQKEKPAGASSKKTIESQLSTENANEAAADDATAGAAALSEDESKPKTGEESGKPTRKQDGKRYSEKRERNRNRRDRDKDKQKSGAGQAEKPAGGATSSAIGKTTPLEGDNVNVNDSVLTFIRNVATTKEFVPKSKEKATASEGNEGKDAAAAANDSESLTSSMAPSDGAAAGPAKGEDKKAKEGGGGPHLTAAQRRSAEERRIRNKDRPSIAIYQPKARLRASEESDNSTGKETRNSINSDGGDKKNAQKKKKHSSGGDPAEGEAPVGEEGPGSPP